ncbi:tellurium resistance protein [Streptomyces triticiradicis]|uniref:Tellurium resistance protein n=1 Tax=Streptomyces triticiradicis TaxID=2651189 RepID=A0A7J5DBS6_9ACTN|nr:tellurium resistance protein [Streptomyces triticiradicis]KAB1986277.1 tellurium resistance protein [Streptomyces triticiradicis]
MSNDERPRATIRLRPAPGARQPAPPAREAPRLPAARPKTVLTRSAPHARVTGRGVLQVNLNRPPGTGADLDLGCMAAFTDGSCAAVQPLGNSFGSLSGWPYMELDQDDRTGESADGETVRVDLARRELFRRLLFHVYVYSGAVDFRSLGATATVTAPSGGFRIPLDESPEGATGCAIALATPVEGGLTVSREVRWFTGTPRRSVQEQMDGAYGFGLAWVRMRKD